MDIRKCQNCQCSSNEDFKEVVNLKGSGLMIYIHGNKSKQKGYYNDYRRNNVILHNTSDRDLKRFDYIVELCQYRTKCLKCKMLIQRVRSVIDDISSINRNEIIGVCDFCKQSHQKNKCKRCQYIVEKFINNKAIKNEIRDEKFKLLLSNLQQILLYVLESKVICRHNICLDFEYKMQLHRLLNSLNSPVLTRQPEIAEFPDLFDLKENGGDTNDSRRILENLVTKLNCKEVGENADINLSLSLSSTESECICKYFENNKREYKPGPSVAIETTLMTPSDQQKHYESKSETITKKSSTDQKLKMTELSKKTGNRQLKINKENDQQKKKTNDLSKEKSNDLSKEKSNDLSKGKSNDLSKEKSNDIVYKGSQKGKKEDKNSQHRLMLEMLKDRDKQKHRDERVVKTKIKHVLPPIKEKTTTTIKPPKMEVNAENLEAKESENILECKDNNLEVIKKMIKGTHIVPLDSRYRNHDKELAKLPPLYKIKTRNSTSTNYKQPISFQIAKSDKKIKKHGKENSMIESGVVRYQLSNREFIDKGWTKLPSTKIMRRMNIYKMLPASDKFDWFQSYRKQEYLFYHTGEKFAEINDAGGGKWFYKNGNVALDAHSAEDSNTVKRYVVYSSGEELVNERNEPITILACFDSLGNGVVYDCYGNVRLKYNQSEGELMDKKISAPGRWKWHTLNDPPVLLHVYLDTYDSNDDDVGLSDFNSLVNNIDTNDEMVAIELDNFLKEKAHKLTQKFKPFQIRIKVLKINDFFSLRILDQANIVLLFRCDGQIFKISIGMLLVNDEIIDTDVAEVSEVSTPYDQYPPKSQSLTNIRNILSNVRKHYCSSKKNK